MSQSVASLTRERVHIVTRVQTKYSLADCNTQNANILKSLQTVVREGFRTRLFQAHKALETREGLDIGREEIGRRVGKALGIEAVNRDTVAAWFTRSLPPADVGIGLAIVYDIRAGWLYFGEEQENSRASVPPEEGRHRPYERATGPKRRSAR